MTYNYFISENTYNSKPIGNAYAGITYRKHSGTMCELFKSLTEGRIMTYDFRTSDGTLTATDKKISNFKQTEFMLFDFDDCVLTPQQAITALNDSNIRPAFVYTTYSHGTNNRFRVCLVLDTRITNQSDYRYVYTLLCRKLESINSGLIADKRCTDCSRAFLGTKTTELSFNRYYMEYAPLSVAALKREYADVKPVEIRHKKTGDFSKCFTNIYFKHRCLGIGKDAKSIDITNDAERMELINDFKYLFIMRHTPVKYDTTDGQEFIEISEPFYEARLPNGYFKLKDGMHRHAHLYAWGSVRRLIKPDATFDEILLSLITDASKNISFNPNEPAEVRKDGTIILQQFLDIHDFITITNSIMTKTLEQLKSEYRPRFENYMPNGYGEIKLKPGWKRRLQTYTTQRLVDELKYKGELNLFNLNALLLKNGMKQITAETYRQKYQPKRVKEKKPKPVKQPKTKKYDLVGRYYNPNISAYRCFKIMVESGVKISQTMVKNYYRDMYKKISEKTCVNV